MKKSIIVLMLSAIICVAVFAQQISETSLKIDYKIRDSADYIGNRYINAWSLHPHVLTFINNDGSVTVCASNTSTTNFVHDQKKIINSEGAKTYIYEFDINLKEQNILTIPNEIGDLGAFTKDNDGNYYFFFTRDESDKNTENMAMVKYDRECNKIKTYKLNAYAKNSFDGIKGPFYSGTCRLELSRGEPSPSGLGGSSGSMLAVYFARLMFGGHQASYGFILDKDTFERIDRGQIGNDRMYLFGNNIMPYVSHSFNQFILPIENGFVFADQGDGYPRCFTFAKFQNGETTKNLKAFTFPGSIGENATYSEMGGLAKTSKGYIFAGAYGRERNNPRNLFVLTFDEDLKACSSLIYLTKYTSKEGHAGHPKIVSTNNGQYVLLWELFKFSTESANNIGMYTSDYISTYMLIIDEQGKAVSEPKELKGIRLSMNDTLRYNPHNGKVYWAINEGDSAIKIYALESE